jgi:hypothetical protein
MVKLLSRGAAGIAVLTGITVTWSPYHSSLYPYSIAEPSSFKHAVLTLDASGQKVDYFSPPVGSAVTNVTVVATAGDAPRSATSYLRSIDGHDIKSVGSLSVAGARRELIRANFDGYPGKWTIEEMSFEANGYYWRISMSYARQFKNLRSVMLKMLRSFKLTAGAAKYKRR